METKDQSTVANQNDDLQDSTTAANADTQESNLTSEKLDKPVEANNEAQTEEEAKQQEKEVSLIVEEAPTELSVETISKTIIKKEAVVAPIEEPVNKESEDTPTDEVIAEKKEDLKDETKELQNSAETQEAPSDKTKKEIVSSEIKDGTKDDLNEKVEDVTEPSDKEKSIVGSSTEETKENSEKEKDEDFSSFELEDLAKRLVELVNETDDILSIKDKVAAIKGNYITKIKEYKQSVYDKFIEDGGTEEDYKTVELPYEEDYKNAFSVYKTKRSAYLKKLEQEKESNLIKKEELLEKLRKMIKSDEPLKKTYDEFKNLQEQWRQIGMIPQSKVKNLWENYHFLVDQFFDKVQISRELRDLDLRKNLEEKIRLSEKAEELLLEKSINKSFKLLQEYHDKWREVGSVPMDKKDEIWDRFKAATDKINKRRHDYYEKLQEEQKNNLMLKAALCERIEEMIEVEHSSIKEWNSGTEGINGLFAEWKTLGPAPKRQNDEIWDRFKTAMNQFFDKRKEYFKTISEEQTYNYNLKLDICRQAEAAKNSTDWKETSNELIKLQKQWKELGSVPRKYSDKIWKRFRASCDFFFNAKTEYFKNIGSIEEGNLTLKKELIEKLKSHKFSDKKEDNLKTIKEFQKEWSDIGRVPFKELNRIQKEFRKHIDKCLDNLNIDSFEFQNMNLKSKIDGMKDKGEAKKTILREMNYFKTKIDKIKADVILWETNIGFFASSKNADLLMQEFENKIDKAKKEIDTFKAKIRQMDKIKRGLDEKPKEESPEA